MADIPSLFDVIAFLRKHRQYLVSLVSLLIHTRLLSSYPRCNYFLISFGNQTPKRKVLAHLSTVESNLASLSPTSYPRVHPQKGSAEAERSPREECGALRPGLRRAKKRRDQPGPAPPAWSWAYVSSSKTAGIPSVCRAESTLVW